jgi:hypothetical protein
MFVDEVFRSDWAKQVSHYHCINFELWQDQNDLFECLVVPSCKEAEVVPTPSIPNTSPPPPIEKPPFNSEGQGGELP